MVQLKKTVARRVLRGMCVLGILIGFGFIYFAIFFTITMFFPIPRDDIAFLCIELLTLVFILALGIFLIRDSYLMLRGKAFGAIKDFSVIVALTFLGLFGPLWEFIENVQVKEKMVRFIEGIVAVAFLISFWLVYLICVKLLERLLEVAYGPEKVSGTQNSVKERKENVEAT